MQRTDTLKEWLRDWAQWFETASGYSDSTVIGRAMAGKLAMCDFGSTIPLGAEPPRSLAALCYAMTSLTDTEYAEAVRITQAIYKAEAQGKDDPHAYVAAQHRKSKRTAYRLRGAGESAIRAWLRAH